MRTSPARDLALRVLRQVEEGGGYANNLIELESVRNKISDEDMRFSYLLVYGVLRYRNRLDWVLSHYSRYPVDSLTSWIRNILRIGAYQILEMPDFHNNTAVDESVKLAHKYGHRGTVSLVNAVLRSVASGGCMPLPSLEDDPLGHLEITQSHPRWLVNRWVKNFGIEKATMICSANNTPPPLTIRLNRIKMKSDRDWDGAFVSPVQSSEISEALIIDGPRPIHRHRFYSEGRIDIQTFSSMLMGHLLSAERGDTILDMCSGSGGKACHIADLIENDGRILCVDKNLRKLRAFKKRAERLGVNICSIVYGMSDKEVPYQEGVFDRVLVDAPCSSLGIIRRHPEIRWLRKEGDIAALSDIQKGLLNMAARAVKRGGRILYCTCSLEPEETTLVLDDFLKTHPHFKIIDIKGFLPEGFHGMICDNGAVRIFPYAKDMDGFFAFSVTK